MSALKGSTLVPAPGRGQYDRALTRSRRQAEQRERLLAATAEAFAVEGRDVSLRAVVERAGTGRNTFYEYFDDVEHALRAVRERALSRLEAALESALATRTPIERLRAVSRAYFDALEQAPYDAALGLWRERESDALSPAGRALEAAYLRAMTSTRAITADDELKALCVAAGAEALFREGVLAPLLESALLDEPGSAEGVNVDERRDVEPRHERRAHHERSRLGDEWRSGASSPGRAKSPVELLVDLAVRVLR